jgi:hypothetical protein
MPALAAWGAARAAGANALAQRRDTDGPMLDRALELVRKFVAARRLVLFGGLAIDFALRLHGAAIYPDDERPDYDMLSPTSVRDAYDLADELHRAGFPNVGAIRAMHTQTMRVRVDFRAVADVGYMPPDVYARLSATALEFRGLRSIHPDYQRIDMHRALCYPFNNAPTEDVFHRWRKDIKRFNMFEKYYPILATSEVTSDVSEASKDASDVSEASKDASDDASDATHKTGGGVCPYCPLEHPDAPNTATARFGVRVVSADASVALSGFAAYGVLHAVASQEVYLRAARDKDAGVPDAEIEQRRAAALLALGACAAVSVEFPDDFTVKVGLPEGVPREVELVGPDPDSALETSALETDSAIDDTSVTVWYDTYADAFPPSARRGNAIVVSSRGRLLAAKTVKYKVKEAEVQVVVASPQFVGLTFLYYAHRADGPTKLIYRAFYAHLLEVMRVAETLYEDFSASPFAPTVDVIGTINHAPSYIVQIASSAARLREAPPAALGIAAGEHVDRVLAGLPTNYFPARSRVHPEFNPKDCLLFQMSGAEEQ